MIADPLVRAIDEISIAEVEGPQEDPETIIIEDGPTAHEHYALYLIQIRYKRLLAEVMVHEPNPRHSLRKRALDMAKTHALQWLTKEGHGLIDRTTAYLFEEASRTGWYKNSTFEWSDVTEMVADMMDSTEEDSSEYWDWLTFANKILPAAEAAGIPPGMLMTSATQVRKLRQQLVPSCNHLFQQMKDDIVTPEEGEKQLAWLLEMAANPTISSAKMKLEVDSWRGRKVDPPPPVYGIAVELPGNRTLFVTETPDNVSTRLVENSLRSRVTFERAGLASLIKLLKELTGLKGVNDGDNESID